MKKNSACLHQNGEGNLRRVVNIIGASASPSTSAVTSLPASDLARHLQDWLYDCQFQQHSPRTIEFRQHTGEKMLWFLHREKAGTCGLTELRRFLAHVANGHEEPGGRWGNPRMNKPVRSATLHRYYRELRTLFAWLVKEGVLSESPVERITPPVLRSEQIQPFTPEQQAALVRAAQRSTQLGAERR
jgi:site-specific recombinase XerD